MFGIMKKSAIIGVRCLQMLCVAAMITGFIWSTADYLLATALVDSPVAPLSVLLMLYGTIGTLGTELSARLLSRSSSDAAKN